MKLKTHPDCHLTYCTNIHPGEEWKDHFAQLKIHLPKLKNSISPENSFGIGLRLSAKAATELGKPDVLAHFREWLHREDLYLFTINGFPFGSFHGERVKDNVYAPDWSKKKRLDYTLNLIYILAELLPESIDGGISTSPISYKYWHKNKTDVDRIFRDGSNQLAEATHRMAEIDRVQNKELHLDIEPEPDCLIENSTETLRFFTKWLFPVGSEYLEKNYGYSRKEALKVLRKHIRVCYDTCHFALEYEDPIKAVKKITQAGIRIGKTQISSALKVELNGRDDRQDVARKLKSFDEPVYLHQVIELRTDGSIRQYRDLPDALPVIDDPQAKEWRIHFHVPVFADRFNRLKSTQDHIREGIKPLLESGCKHFEIETYTWEVLPDELKTDITDSIIKEYRRTLELIDNKRSGKEVLS